ncbi:hypothetical protein PQX77_014445 [Marasmius sp. AFHP31]|nr:hypothetical protein PQX77_014445 [Marasmius sp. AFHP31]
MDKLHVSTYSSISHPQLILDVEPEADKGEGRSPEDSQHLATMLTILLTHTINVRFDSRGVPCGADRLKVASEESQVSKVAAAKERPAVPVKQVTPGDGNLEHAQEASMSYHRVDVPKVPRQTIVPVNGTIKAVEIAG